MPYVVLQSMIDDDTRHGLGHYSRSHWLGGYDDDLIDTLVERFAAVSSPMSHIITARMGGAVERVAPDATAFAHRAPRTCSGSSGSGTTRRQTLSPTARGSTACSRRRVRTARAGCTSTRSRRRAERVRAAYGEATFERLRRVKRHWDPRTCSV